MLLVAAIASCSLLGWMSDQPLLTTFVAGRPSLAPMTALMFLLSVAAASVLPRWRTGALILFCIQAAGGLAIWVMQESGTSAQTGIPAQWWASAVTGSAFTLSGAAGALLAGGKVSAGQVMAFAVLMFALLLGLGHVFPAADLYDYLPGTGVAIPTVVGFASLSTGLLLASSDRGLAGALTSRSPAGQPGRRLLLIVLASLLLFAMLLLAGHRQRMFDAETAILLMAWAAMALIGAALWSLAVAVDRAEQAKVTAEGDRHRLRSMLMAALTHDLRNPLQTAVLSARLLERPLQDAQRSTALARLRRSHQRLDRLLRSLLDSLAFEAGRPLELHAGPVALHELVAEVISENEPALGQRASSSGAAHGWWDRDALFRVIENLLLNAVKYGQPASGIQCRISCTENTEVVLEVENQGPAIASENWESIFQAFTRGANQGKGQPGWGVGLAFARSVANRHAGTLRVASSGPQGTVFELRLPGDARLRLAEPASADALRPQ